jgi:hypothetical protein
MARSVKGTGTFFCALTVLLIVGFYTLLELNVLDDFQISDVVEIKSATQINEETEAATLQLLDDDPVKDDKKNYVTKVDDKVSDSCSDFDHGDISHLKNLTSIFNCGSESGTCEWYYPSKFLDSTCGVGKEFSSQLDYMKEVYDAKELWLSGPPIVLPWASIIPADMKPNPFKDGPWNRHNLSMTHVHKTGGTSLVTAFGSVLSKGAKGKRRTVYMPGKKPMPMTEKQQRLRGKMPPKSLNKSVIYGRSYNDSSAFLDGATKYKRPEDWGEKDHTLFAVVRDPAERFISAIGQATGAFGSSANGIGKQLLNECLKETTKATLNCFIDLMQTNSTWIEVHFTPMVLEISFATIYKDIPVAVFPFTEVSNLLRELASDPNSKKKDGHKSGYRKSEVLTNLTVADYDTEMLTKLCDVYKMDAILKKHLGMPTMCDKVLDV